jgi:hypothetical protein
MNSRISDVKIEWRYPSHLDDRYSIYQITFTLDKLYPMMKRECVATNELQAFQRFMDYANKRFLEGE